MTGACPRLVLFWGVLCVLQLGVCAAPARGAKPYTPVYADAVREPWRWTRYRKLNGLGLSCLEQGADGAMWFGVKHGVIRYDGVNWKTFGSGGGLVHGPIRSLARGPEGGIYAASADGISRYADGAWARVFPPDDGIAPWDLRALSTAQDGSIWAASGWGAIRLKGARVELFTTAHAAKAVHGVAPGVPVRIVPDSAVSLTPWGEGIGLRTAPAGPEEEAGIGIVWDVAAGGPADEKGLHPGDRVLSRRVSGGRARLRLQPLGSRDTVEVEMRPRRLRGGSRGFSVTEVFQDADGVMWFCTRAPESLVCFDARAGAWNDPRAWRIYGAADGLDIGSNLHITQSPDGAIWVVSEHARHGVNRFNGLTWTHFMLGGIVSASNEGELHTDILATRDGSLWIGSFGVIYRLWEGKWRAHTYQDVVDMPWQRVRLFQASDGALWVAGLGQDAARLEIGTNKWETYSGLAYQCETADGARWFLSSGQRVVRNWGGVWTSFGAEDGLPDIPVMLMSTQTGELWALGSRDSCAAVSLFKGSVWDTRSFPAVSQSFVSACEAKDGSLWLGPADRLEGHGQLGGVVRLGPPSGTWDNGNHRARDRFEGRAVTYLGPPEAPNGSVLGIAQTKDGRLWFGGSFGLHCLDGGRWSRQVDPEPLLGYIEDVVVTPSGDVLVCTRTSGLYQYDGRHWQRYDVQAGLSENSVMGALPEPDGTIWTWTTVGTIDRFDGRSWSRQPLHPLLRAEGGLVRGTGRSLWLNGQVAAGGAARTIHYRPDDLAPDVQLALAPTRVSQPGNVTFTWKGTDPWKPATAPGLQYSWRLDDAAWSPYSARKSAMLHLLPSGKHVFQVTARDRDLNVDPTPASVRFTVAPPVWQEPWFVGFVLALAAATGIQTVRVLKRGRSLRESVRSLSTANRDLFEANRSLERERAVERIRERVQLMEASPDFKEAERLVGLVERLGRKGASAAEIRDGIAEDVRAFIGEAAQSDDMTVVVLKAA